MRDWLLLSGPRSKAAPQAPLPTMLPSALGGALAYHYKADAGVRSGSGFRIPGTTNGTSGNPACPSSASLQFANQQGTVVVWAMVDNLTSTMTLLSKNATGANEWDLFIQATTGVAGIISIFGVSPFFHATSTGNAVTANVPFMVAWGFDGTNQWIRLNNGTRVNTTHSTTTHALTATSAQLKMGVNDSTTEPLSGAIGHIGIWKGRSLSNAELDSLYNSGNGRDYDDLSGLGLLTNLSAYYRNQQRDGSVFDSTANANHFTSTTRCQATNFGTICAIASTDGLPVSQWQDQSANARHLGATTSATNLYNDFRPQYLTNRINSLPTVMFHGKEQTVRLAFTLAQPVHQFWLVRPHNWRAGLYIGDGNTENRAGLTAGSTTHHYGLNAGASAGGPIGTTVAVPTKRWSIVEACFDGSSSFIRVNGGAKVTVNAGTSTTAGLWMALDGGNDLGSDYAKHGVLEVAEMFGATAAQSDADSTLLRRYITNKYGLGSEAGAAPAWSPSKLVVMDGASINAGFSAGCGRGPLATALSTLGSDWDGMDMTWGGKLFTECRSDYVNSSWAYDSGRTKNVYCAIIPSELLSNTTAEALVPGGTATQQAQAAWDLYKLHLAEVRAVGWKVIAATPGPFLTALVGNGYEARRTQFGIIARADTSAYDALCDIAADSDIGVAVSGETPDANSLWRVYDRTHWSWRGAEKLGNLYATAIASV